MAEYRSTAEWEQVLEGALSFLRTHAAQELSFSAVMRVERTAWRRSQELIAGLGLSDGDAPLATDELLKGAVSPAASRQAVTEQVLGATPGQAARVKRAVPAENAAEPTFNPEADLPDAVDDGPEGVADDANREVSEEYEEVDVMEPLDTSEVDEDEDIDDMATAAPGLVTPLAPASRIEDFPGEDTHTFEGELDLDSLDATSDPDDGPLIPDFDFADEEEQDETVVFAMGMGETGEAIARVVDEKTDAQNAVGAAGAEGDDGFDLMPDLGDDLVLEELEFDFDEDNEEQTVLDAELDIELDMPVHTPEPAPLPIDTRGGRARPGVQMTPSPSVTAGLYANPNVPTVREGRSAPPRAAAISINAKQGTGKVMGFEQEEEPLEIGSAEDYGEDEEEAPVGRSGGGFSLNIQEYEAEYEEEEESQDQPQPAAPPKPVFRAPDAGQIAGVLKRAQEAAAAGDMQAGVELFSDVLDADPDNIDGYVGRGRLYLDLGDYSRSMSDFITAEDLAPNSPEPQVAIGDLYFARKDYRKAIDYFNGALSMDPNHAMAHCRRGISHYYRKNYSDALTDLKTAEQMNRDIPNIGTYISMARKKAKK